MSSVSASSSASASSISSSSTSASARDMSHLAKLSLPNILKHGDHKTGDHIVLVTSDNTQLLLKCIILFTKMGMASEFTCNMYLLSVNCEYALLFHFPDTYACQK